MAFHEDCSDKYVLGSHFVVSFISTLVQHYGIIALVAMVTWTFHYIVGYWFSEEMVTGYQEETAKLNRQVKFAQLEMMYPFCQAIYLHNGSQSNVQEAYEIEG
jgi:hypothetical protein